VITDTEGVPLLVKVTAANVNDDTVAIRLLDCLPRLRNMWGKPRSKPIFFQGDRAYGTKNNIAQTQARGIFSELAPRGSTTHGSGLGKTRYVVERTLSWFGNFRRLKLCYEKTGAHFQAFHDLAAALICAKKLPTFNLRF
jgi:transposase